MASSSSSEKPDREKFVVEKRLDENEKGKEEVFIDWLKNNGAVFSEMVELRAYDDEVRGVHAARDIADEEIVMEIPLSCLITVEMGKETEVGRAVLEAELDLDAPKHVFLMLFVLCDRKKPGSRFKPYYDMLPATLSNMPIFWNEDELSYLEGSYLTTQIEERKRAIATDFEAIRHACPSFDCTLEEFKWARMCVCSRNFGVVVNGVRTSALVPYADMLNHYRPRETKWTYDNSRGAFTITALQNIEKGAQIYDSYGQKCNHRFLLNYGFAIEDNAEPDGFCPNEVPLAIELRKDKLLPRKQLLWFRDGSSLGPKRIRVCAADNENFRAVMSLLRIVVADEPELERVIGQNPYASSRTATDLHSPISLRNETQALQLLGDMCRNLLAKYPTTVEDDTKKLETLAPFSNARHAVIHVRSEKIVLNHYVRLSQTAIAMASEPLGEPFDSALSSLFDNKSHDYRHVASYCNSVLRQVKRQSPQIPHPNYAPDATRRNSGQSPIDFSAPTIV